MSQDPNDFLTGGGVPSAKFPTIGTLVKGTVLDFEMTQQTDLDGNKKTWDNGDPMMQLVVTLQTEDRDADITDDEGKRKLYVKGQMRNAIGEALKKAGARLEKGATLAVKYTADGEVAKRGHNPPKQYVAAFQAPTVGADDLLGTSGAPSAAPAPAPEPAGGGVADDELL